MDRYDAIIPAKSGWNKFKNLLCIRPDNIGDVLMTTPGIRALKHSVKGRKITLLASRSGGGICRYIPEIDDVIEFDFPWYKHTGHAAAASLFEVIKEIKSRQFDAAVIFTVYSQQPQTAAMLCYMAGIPRVAGYCRENPYALISDWVPDPEPLYQIKHEVTRQLDLVKELGARVRDESLSLQLPAGAEEALNHRLYRLGVELKKPWLVLHPGASEDKRQYPAHLFVRAAEKIIHELRYQILLTGSEAEKPLVETIARQLGNNAFSLAGKCDIAGLIALIKQAPLLISNNTGPVHIAAAMKTPVIVLYALTNPQHTPWMVKHRVLPFGIPETDHSKNIIIRYANARSFIQDSGMTHPDEIFRAATLMLNPYSKTKRTEILRLSL